MPQRRARDGAATGQSSRSLQAASRAAPKVDRQASYVPRKTRLEELLAESSAAKEAMQEMQEGFQSIEEPKTDLEKVEQDLRDHMHQKMFKLFMQSEEQRVSIIHMKGVESRLHTSRHATISRIKGVKEEMAGMEAPKDDTKELQGSVEGLEGHLAELTEKYAEGKGVIEGKLKEWRSEVRRLETEVMFLEFESRGDEVPPGPMWLQWTQEDWWQRCSGTVLLLNMLKIFLSFTHPHRSFFCEECAFCAFYTFELGCSLAYLQLTFFTGSLRHKIFNVLDIIVVVSFIVQIAAQLSNCSHGILALLRCAVAFRVLRLSKIIHAAFTMDVSWVEDSTFQSFMAVIVGANVLLMGLETELKGWIQWTYLENIFLLFYAVEIWARMKLHGVAAYFRGGGRRGLFWNYLDVSGAIFSSTFLWVLPFFHGLAFLVSGTSVPVKEPHDMVTLCRVARLARLLHVEELRSFPPLYNILKNAATAAPQMGTVMLLAASALYVSALLGVKLVGKGWMPPFDAADMGEARAMMGKTSDAFWHLFLASFGHASSIDPVVEGSRAAEVLLMLLLILVQWVCFSILVAVTMAHVAAGRRERTERKRVEEEVRVKEERSRKMEAIFRRADDNNDNLLNLQEFSRLLSDEETAWELGNCLDVPDTEVLEVFELISRHHDRDREESVTHDDFLRLLDMESAQSTCLAVLHTEKLATEVEARFQHIQEMPEVANAPSPTLQEEE